MAYVIEDLGYVAGIYQIEITDDVVGGVDGTSNIQAKELASRTKYLYDRFFDKTSMTLDNITNGTTYTKTTAAETTLLKNLNEGTLSGNLGIGKVPTSYKLEVNGDTSSDNFIINDLNNNIAQIATDMRWSGIPETEKSKWSLSYNASTRQLSLTLSSASYYYVKGKRFNISGTLTWTAHANTAGIYYCYFDETGARITSDTVWEILDVATVAYVIYHPNNAGLGTPDYIIGNEFHGNVMSPATHKYEHLAEGTRYLSGAAISGYSLLTETLTAIQWQLDTGHIADEDLIFDTPTQGKGNYLLGYLAADGTFNWKTSTTFPIFVNTGTNTIQYNPVGGGLVDLSVNDTFINYYIALNNADAPSKRILVVPGQTVHTSLANAQAESIANLAISNIPFREYVFIYQITFRYRSTYAVASGKSRIEATPVKISISSNAVITSSISTHNALSGRSDSGAHPASAINTDTTNFNGMFSSTITNTQLALDILDDNYFSSGVLDLPTFTDNGNGSATIGQGRYCLSTNTLGGNSIRTYTLTPSPATITFTDNTVNYVIADYNSGSPLVYNTTDVTIINEINIIPIFTVYREGTTLTYLNWNHEARHLANKLNLRCIKTERFKREDGLSLSESATRIVNITQGRVWYGSERTTISTFASNVHPMYLHYHSGGVWTKALVTQYNNTQYDNGTTLQTLGVGRYAVNWVYRKIGAYSQAEIVLGTANYTLAEAQASQPPSVLPASITAQAILVGRIIVEYNVNTAYQIDSVFNIVFTQNSETINHNNLFNVQGGISEQYYHLSSAEYTVAQNAVDKRTFAAKGNLLVGTAANTYTALTAGTNDYVLTADSSTTSGLKWATVPTPSPVSFIPSLFINGLNTGITYTTRVGNYIKTGNYCFITGRIVLSSKASLTGAVTLGNLPFTSSATNMSTGLMIPWANFSGLVAGGSVSMAIGNSTTSIDLLVQTTTGINTLTDANLSNTSDLRFSIGYITA